MRRLLRFALLLVVAVAMPARSQGPVRVGAVVRLTHGEIGDQPLVARLRSVTADTVVVASRQTEYRLDRRRLGTIETRIGRAYRKAAYRGAAIGGAIGVAVVGGCALRRNCEGFAIFAPMPATLMGMLVGSVVAPVRWGPAALP